MKSWIWSPGLCVKKGMLSLAALSPKGLTACLSVTTQLPNLNCLLFAVCLGWGGTHLPVPKTSQRSQIVSVGIRQRTPNEQGHQREWEVFTQGADNHSSGGGDCFSCWPPVQQRSKGDWGVRGWHRTHLLWINSCSIANEACLCMGGEKLKKYHYF